MYFLRKGYRRNKEPVQFDDHAVSKGRFADWEWQPDVYPYAAERAKELGVGTIIDVGCGAARKLIPLADSGFKVVGLDRKEIVDKIKAKGHWVAADFQSDDPLPFSPPSPAVWVCSDVVEHLVGPDILLSALLEKISVHDDRLIISTPDRSRMNWTRQLGPPRNKSHVQEWTLDELLEFLSAVGFTIISSDHTRSNDHEPDLATSLIEVSS